eukprot:c13890_g1_i2.p1 GENE.c13890_g1_i2~~c13890_g1_i2.p1  ORF type:complete len:233 (+),score=44.32 c13890_g1_i2:41-700(+)
MGSSGSKGDGRGMKLSELQRICEKHSDGHGKINKKDLPSLLTELRIQLSPSEKNVLFPAKACSIDVFINFVHVEGHLVVSGYKVQAKAEAQSVVAATRGSKQVPAQTKVRPNSRSVPHNQNPHKAETAAPEASAQSRLHKSKSVSHSFKKIRETFEQVDDDNDDVINREQFTEFCRVLSIDANQIHKNVIFTSPTTNFSTLVERLQEQNLLRVRRFSCM